MAAVVSEPSAADHSPPEHAAEPVAAGTQAPAVRVADTYVDGVLEALEREIDLVPERQEVFEGRALSADEELLFRRFAEQIRAEVDWRVCAFGFRVPRVDPEHMGHGFRFYWTARGREGHVDYHYDDVLRFMRDGETAAKFGEPVGRAMILGLVEALKGVAAS